MENSKVSIGSAKEFLAALVGKECWAAVAGNGTGSMVSFEFGEKIRRKRALSSPTLSPEVREFNSEFTVFVRGGAQWVLKRAKGDESLICSNDSGNEAGGEMLSGLSLLIGKKVSSTERSEDFMELALNFDNSLVFQMTCIANGMDGYFLMFGADAIAIVGRTEKQPGPDQSHAS